MLMCLQMGGTVEQQLERKMAFVRELKCLPVAVQTAAANEQHYEVRTCTCWHDCSAYSPQAAGACSVAGTMGHGC